MTPSLLCLYKIIVDYGVIFHRQNHKDYSLEKNYFGVTLIAEKVTLEKVKTKYLDFYIRRLTTLQARMGGI